MNPKEMAIDLLYKMQEGSLVINNNVVFSEESIKYATVAVELAISMQRDDYWTDFLNEVKKEIEKYNERI